MTKLVNWAVFLVFLLFRITPGIAMPAGQNLPMAEATADTALVTLLYPEGSPDPLFVSVIPDTVNFGDIVQLVLDFPVGSNPVENTSIAFSEDWLVPEKAETQSDSREITTLPEASGPRIVLPARVYRVWPFQVASGSGVSSVIHVRGKVENLQDVAAIRSPRLWGMDSTQLIIFALFILAVALLVWWLWWRHGALPPVMEGHQQGPVSWLATAVAMIALRDLGLVERGETRKFLSDLAGIARGYMGGRYFIGAEEMTGKEIEKACLAQGYDVSSVRPFAQFIRRVDQMRYNPEMPQPSLCRHEFGALIKLIEAVRISSDHSSMTSATEIFAGEQAWSQLIQVSANSEGGLS